jgi:hypothetical protein
MEKTRAVNRRRNRILDRRLHAVEAFTAICARDATVPRSGELLTPDELVAAAGQQLTELNNRYEQLDDQLGEHLRDELDRLGTGRGRLARPGDL